MATTTNQATAPAISEKGVTTYNVAGSEVKLSFPIVRHYLVKGASDVTDQELMQFIAVCKYNQLNPFLNEAYLVKYSGSPAQMVVSKEAYFKRADACPDYEGIKAGIIVENEDGSVEDVEGCFYSSKQKLVGGWAEVHRKDRRFPVIARVRLSEYSSGKALWNTKQSTMIAKVAKVQALREAFPAQLGAMYVREEANIQDAAYEEVKEEKKQFKDKPVISFDAAQPDTEPDPNVDRETGEIPAPGASAAHGQGTQARMPGF
ncbi:MAG: phage recombination protein Bet [Prevotella sp.]|nr:phage recombination protein Bet [Prevotella sp.]